MRKRVVEQDGQKDSEVDYTWLSLESLAQAEITSEAEGYPVESALIPESGSYWQAADAGEQAIRLLFDSPQRISLIRLLFKEEHQERTQEFVLRWSPDGVTFHDIARQQYNFSMPDSTLELEDYSVELDGVAALELRIIPNISGGDARASLAECRVAA
jgi:hypothetical protein